MGWKIPSIRALGTLLGLSLFTLPVLGLLDTEASDQKLDSVYIGELSAAWADADCGERLLSAVIDNTKLTFGPVHNATIDSNLYFISLVSPETDDLTVTMQSSVSSEKLKTAWWDVDAKLAKDNSQYSVSGKMAKDQDLELNEFSGKFGDGNSSLCGFKSDSFEWKFSVDTSKFTGNISREDAAFQIEGRVMDEKTSHFISYTIQFRGKWDSKTAQLDLSASKPTWSKPGNNEATTTTTTASSIPSVIVDMGPVPTGTSDEAEDDNGSVIDDISKKLGIGAVAGILAGAILLFGLIGMAICCAFNRRRRHREAGKVYPEVAYIYTPSPDPSLDSSHSGYSKIVANYQTSYRSGSDLDMREVLVNDYSLPVTNQHQWRQF